ncbi:hypothetical protein AB1Y20_023316 [Prymnesium parvum]|uniref:Protein-tyrosine sulfotransferase n=1 Tax=Prymnesium parvum TaxID=97485 RepID=A0AB34JDI8_PRYPA
MPFPRAALLACLHLTSLRADSSARYAYGITAPLDLPSPPPPDPPANPGTAPPSDERTCRADRRYAKYLHMRAWTAEEAAVERGAGAAAPARGYSCYRHREVASDAALGRSTCGGGRRCGVLEPTFPTRPSQCLCCPMAGHSCPTCWGCLMPLSRRRAFAGKLYERETGGTADVFLASERVGGDQVDVVFKLRKGEVTERERQSTRLVDAVAARCGLLRPLVAREWVAELAVIPPLPANLSRLRGSAEAAAFAAAAERMAANRRPAIATQLAHGVSIDMLLRTHTQGPNKQEARGAKARDMIQRMRMLDSRSIVRAAIFDFLFAAADRHLEHVLMREGGDIELIDNAHTILTPRADVRFGPNSLFLPGSNFFARNLHGFPFLHCCIGSSVCPKPKPVTCPGRHTLYWPALLLDYRCHVPHGRLGFDFPLQTRRCLAELSTQTLGNLSASLGVGRSGGVRRMLRRLVRRARTLRSLGMEDAWLALDHSHGYYLEGRLHNGEGVPPPCCTLTLDAPTANRQDDEWRCHPMLPPSLQRAQFSDDGSHHLQAAAASQPSAVTTRASGVAPPQLHGMLYSFSTAERLVPTNRSLTPRWLTHRLAREGDWLYPGRVHLPLAAQRGVEQSSEGVAMAAVAVGSGLWAAITARGEAVACVFPCVQLARVPRIDGRRLVGVAAGDLSLFLLSSAGAVYAAAADVSVRGDGGGETYNVTSHTVPRLGRIVRVRGELESRRVVQIAAGTNAVLARTAEGEVYAWGALPLGRVPPTSGLPVAVPLPGGVVATSIAVGDAHVLVLTSEGTALSAALPPPATASRREGPGGHTPSPAAVRDALLGRGVGNEGAYRLGAIEMDAPQEGAARPTAVQIVQALFWTSLHISLSNFCSSKAYLATPKLLIFPRVPVLSSVYAAECSRKQSIQVAVGRLFSLALIGYGEQRGRLLYWGARPRHRRARVPGARPSLVHRWCSWLARERFVLISASGEDALALSDRGELWFWRHGASMPSRLEGLHLQTEPLVAFAVRDGVALALVPSFDMRRERATAPRLARPPAPLARPVLTRSDNIGVAQLWRAAPQAMGAATDGFNSSWRTPCWRPGSALAGCPLKRAADCAQWRPEDKAPRLDRASARRACLPAALLLGARGCGGEEMAQQLASHPDVTLARAAEPWWQFKSLSTFLEGLRGETAEVDSRGATQLLLQRTLLDVVSTGAQLRRDGVTLADLLPRVQPQLRVLLLVCHPVGRLSRLSPAVSASRLRAQRKAFEACAREASALSCASQLHARASELLDGAYALSVREVLRALPTAQVRLIRYEDWRARPGQLLDEVFSFLHLESNSSAGAHGRETSTSFQAGERAAKDAASISQVGDDVRAAVHGFYDDFNAELAQLSDSDSTFTFT